MGDRFMVAGGLGSRKHMSTIQKCKTSKSLSAEKLATNLAGMSRSQLKRKLLSIKTRFPLDFTEEFLNSLSSDRLRHILLAAQLNSR